MHSSLFPCFVDNGADITVWYNISEMIHTVIAWIMLYALQIFLPLQMINTCIDGWVGDFANTTEIQHCCTANTWMKSSNSEICTAGPEEAYLYIYWIFVRNQKSENIRALFYKTNWKISRCRAVALKYSKTEG